jgi:hypothetical protein
VSRSTDKCGGERAVVKEKLYLTNKMWTLTTLMAVEFQTEIAENKRRHSVDCSNWKHSAKNIGN